VEKNIPNEYGKVILLRDVLKQWYLKGVNINIDSIDALANFLKQETVGYEVTCVGVSSGGFIASIIGCLIGAERVFNFSGQFDLTHILKDEVVMRRNPILSKNKDNIQVNKYFNICNKIKYSNVPIFYFYPGLSTQDISQAEFVKNIQNVYAFNFKNKKHGLPIWRNNIGELLVLDNQKLIKLHNHFSEKMISKASFSLKVSGYRKTIFYAVETKKDSLKRLLKNA